MNEYDLFDAMNGIDDDLLLRAEHSAVRKIPIRRALIAAAAVMLLAVTAIATPAVREFISANGSELIGGGFYITLEKLGIVNQYVQPHYEVELKVPASPDVPDYIQDFRVPTYFVKNGWIMDHIQVDSDSEPDAAMVLFFAPDNPVPQASFQQLVFYPSDDPSELWYHFSMSGVGDEGLKEDIIIIGDTEATLYHDRTIIWSDGQYAYELSFHYDVEASEVEEAVLSMESVDLLSKDHAVLEDILSDEYKTPIETFYTLGKLPEGFVLTDRTWNINRTWEHYEVNMQKQISFKQCVNASEENLGPSFSVEEELLSRALAQRIFTAEEYMVDGVEVTIFREEGVDLTLMWHLDDYCFRLSFSYDPGLTDEELLDYYRSVQPMPDFTENLTD